MKQHLQFCVYKITNSISGKSYIGKTCDLKRRWKQHLNRSKYDKTKSKFPRALRKYPEDSWNISILYETNDEDHCYKTEELLVDEYDTYKNGYNSSLGGKGTGVGKNHPNYNKIVSNKTRKKMSISRIGKPGYCLGAMPWEMPSCKSKGIQINWYYLDKVYKLRIKYNIGVKKIYDILIEDYPKIKKSPTSFKNMFKWIEKMEIQEITKIGWISKKIITVNIRKILTIHMILNRIDI